MRGKHLATLTLALPLLVSSVSYCIGYINGPKGNVFDGVNRGTAIIHNKRVCHYCHKVHRRPVGNWGGIG